MKFQCKWRNRIFWRWRSNVCLFCCTYYFVLDFEREFGSTCGLFRYLFFFYFELVLHTILRSPKGTGVKFSLASGTFFWTVVNTLRFWLKSRIDDWQVSRTTYKKYVYIYFFVSSTINTYHYVVLWSYSILEWSFSLLDLYFHLHVFKTGKTEFWYFCGLVESAEKYLFFFLIFTPSAAFYSYDSVEKCPHFFKFANYKNLFLF